MGGERYKYKSLKCDWISGGQQTGRGKKGYNFNYLSAVLWAKINHSEIDGGGGGDAGGRGGWDGNVFCFPSLKDHHLSSSPQQLQKLFAVRIEVMRTFQFFRGCVWLLVCIALWMHLLVLCSKYIHVCVCGIGRITCDFLSFLGDLPGHSHFSKGPLLICTMLDVILLITSPHPIIHHWGKE